MRTSRFAQSVGARRYSVPVDPIRVVAAVIELEGKFLGCRRAPGKSLAGFWEFPGGKVEPGESDTEALVREIDEELGVAVLVHDVIAESSAKVNDLHVHLLGYRCTLEGSEPIASTDHDLIRWFTREEFVQEDWAPADIPIIRRLLAET